MLPSSPSRPHVFLVALHCECPPDHLLPHDKPGRPVRSCPLPNSHNTPSTCDIGRQFQRTPFKEAWEANMSPNSSVPKMQQSPSSRMYVPRVRPLCPRVGLSPTHSPAPPITSVTVQSRGPGPRTQASFKPPWKGPRHNERQKSRQVGPHTPAPQAGKLKVPEAGPPAGLA